jgi:hypothetical protein
MTYKEMVFNRSTTLRDAWAKANKGGLGKKGEKS